MCVIRLYIVFMCVICVYIVFMCVICVYIYIVFIYMVVSLHFTDFRMVQNIFFPIYSAKFRIKYPTNETKLIHKMRRTNLPHNNFCKCLMFSKIFLSLNSSVHLSATTGAA